MVDEILYVENIKLLNWWNVFPHVLNKRVYKGSYKDFPSPKKKFLSQPLDGVSKQTQR